MKLSLFLSPAVIFLLPLEELLSIMLLSKANIFPKILYLNSPGLFFPPPNGYEN